MSISELAMLIAAALIPAGIFVALIGRYRPAWPTHRTIVLAALPIPFIVWSLCVLLVVKVARSTAAQCGGDACGMMMMAAIYLMAYALIAFGVGALVAWLVRRHMTK